jgi:tetratricopeptide (TPR) repeat protein
MSGWTLKRGAILLLLLLLAAGLRLQVWHWHEMYPPGGDEQEYFQQALTLLREHRYVELRLMRPPLYGVFLAGAIVLVDSLVQQLRLVQVVLSTATLVQLWLLADEVARRYRAHRLAVPALATLLCALSYTLADYATELLTETLFLFGLTLVLWLLVRAGRAPRPLSVALAGVALGLLCLVRSVALPLLPLGLVWLVLATRAGRAKNVPRSPLLAAHSPPRARRWLLPAGVFLFCTLLPIAPWTLRNYATYGAPILIDTTGAENLWLDNDPAGREAVKAQLYALGDDRAARQQLATQRGLQTIVEHPQHVAAKAGRELLHLVALEYSDDMLERRAIWVPPAEVGARLLLGDGVFLLVLLCGVAGLWGARRPASAPDPRWLFAPWALYIVLTMLLFHVELRYRLPLYPVLLPYAALFLTRTATRRPLPAARRLALRLTVLLLLGLMLLHRPYPLLAWHLGWKHLALAHAEHALEQHHAPAAQQAARAALRHDDESVLARVALARAALLNGDHDTAETQISEAIGILPAHPLPHLLRGDLLRQQGRPEAARAELGYETATLQDVQVWCWQHCTTPPTTTLDIGGGLDLGMVRGFHARDTNEGGEAWRWTRGRARVRIAVPPAATTLYLRMASGRPDDAPPPRVAVGVGSVWHTLEIAPRWQTYRVPMPAAAGENGPPQPVTITIISDTFTPRTYDPASNDGRTLGVMVVRVEVRANDR